MTLTLQHKQKQAGRPSGSASHPFLSLGIESSSETSINLFCCLFDNSPYYVLNSVIASGRNIVMN
jgi:hypothetical protein